MDRAVLPAAEPVDVPVDAVREATGRPDAAVRAVERHPVVERLENMTTLAIERVTGTLADGTRWSMVPKTLRPVWAAPAFAQIPDEHRAMVIETLNWLDEPRVYRSGLAQGLPGEFRMPRLYGIEEEPDRLTLWLEDVADRGAWTADRYRRTARCLGRMSGRWPWPSSCRRC